MAEEGAGGKEPAGALGEGGSCSGDPPESELEPKPKTEAAVDRAEYADEAVW